VRRTMSI